MEGQGCVVGLARVAVTELPRPGAGVRRNVSPAGRWHSTVHAETTDNPRRVAHE
jgi:hypothetical protein